MKPTPAQHDDSPERGLTLPLTERPGSASPGSAISEADIRTLVDSFYSTAREDELLGPIFAGHVQNWPRHLSRMHDFWSTIALHSGRYSGRPIEAHLNLPGLTQPHFDRWLSLWEAAVDRVIPPVSSPARGAFILAARRMAASMSLRILEHGEGNGE